jgi:ketosteroid isomerase-like protein
VKLVADSYTKSGRPFNNRYCWACEFGHGRLIKVRAYLDSALISSMLDEL